METLTKETSVSFFFIYKDIKILQCVQDKYMLFKDGFKYGCVLAPGILLSIADKNSHNLMDDIYISQATVSEDNYVDTIPPVFEKKLVSVMFEFNTESFNKEKASFFNWIWSQI